MSNFPRRAAARYQAQPGVAETNTDGPPFNGGNTGLPTWVALPNVNNLTAGGDTALLPSSIDLPPGTTCTISMPDYSGDVTINTIPGTAATLDLGPVTANVDSVLADLVPGAAGNADNMQFSDDGDLYVLGYSGIVGQGYLGTASDTGVFDLSTLALPSNIATKLYTSTFGSAANAQTLEFIGDSVGGAPGQLDDGPVVFVFHFMPGTTTIADFEAAVNASTGLVVWFSCSLFGVLIEGTLGAGDAFGPLNFYGGTDGFPKLTQHFTPGVTNVENFESQVFGSGVITVLTPATPSPTTSTLDLGPLTANVDTILFTAGSGAFNGAGPSANLWNIELIADGVGAGNLDYARVEAAGGITTASAVYTFNTNGGAIAGNNTVNGADGNSYTIEIVGDSPPAGGVTVTRTGAYPNLAFVFHYESGVSTDIDIALAVNTNPLITTPGGHTYFAIFTSFGPNVLTSPGDDAPATAFNTVTNGYSGPPQVRFHFQSGVTTVADFETALAAAVDLTFTPGTGANLFAAGDVLAPTFFAGGTGPVFASPGDLLPATFFSGGVGDLKWGNGYGDDSNYSTTWQTDGAGNWFLRSWTAGE